MGYKVVYDGRFVEDPELQRVSVPASVVEIIQQVWDYKPISWLSRGFQDRTIEAVGRAESDKLLSFLNGRDFLQEHGATGEPVPTFDGTRVMCAVVVEDDYWGEQFKIKSSKKQGEELNMRLVSDNHCQVHWGPFIEILKTRIKFPRSAHSQLLSLCRDELSKWQHEASGRTPKDRRRSGIQSTIEQYKWLVRKLERLQIDE